MTLIKSISGIRGTIGGAPGDNLTPVDIVRFTAAYARLLQEDRPGQRLLVAVGRDARLSGEMVAGLVVNTLTGCGADVIDLGLCTTPGVEMAVTARGACGGIIVTASHNPGQWNALKLLGPSGEFLSADEGNKILELAESNDITYAPVERLGRVISRENFDDEHIKAVLALELVDVEAVRARKFRVAVDAVNSVGGVVIPRLLRAMGIEVTEVNCEPTGVFAHNPEPLPANLTEISDVVRRGGLDLGVVVDPDVDRLALVCENGAMFGEEYTLVAVADYVLGRTPGNTVSNLSSSRALRDVTEAHGGTCSASAVGEVNVVAEMKRTGAVIGGEGNGGVIYPALHYGRDALVGVALFMTHLALSGKTASELRAALPSYHISKNRVELGPGIDPDAILAAVKKKYAGEKISDADGVRIDFDGGWVHLRRSNTEPIIRIYSESTDQAAADALARRIIGEIGL